MLTYSKYNNISFANWIKERAKENPSEFLTAMTYYDDDTEVLYLDLYGNDDTILESFSYMDEEEITEDIATANDEFNVRIIYL